MECIEDVIMLLDQLSKEQKTNYIADIMELIQKDTYGLGTGRVLLKTASRENLPIIEHLILESLEFLSEGTFQREEPTTRKGIDKTGRLRHNGFSLKRIPREGCCE